MIYILIMWFALQCSCKPNAIKAGFRLLRCRRVSIASAMQSYSVYFIFQSFLLEIFFNNCNHHTKLFETQTNTPLKKGTLWRTRRHFWFAQGEWAHLWGYGSKDQQPIWRHRDVFCGRKLRLQVAILLISKLFCGRKLRPVLLTYHMATAPCSDKPISYKNKKIHRWGRWIRT